MKFKWIKQQSVSAYPYGWQRPAKTEEWVYETLVKRQVNSTFVEFICFPWATLIDLTVRKNDVKANTFIDILYELHPKNTLIRATACQHINIEPIIQILIALKVTDLYWAHKVKGVDSIKGIRIHSLPLYPVSFYASGRKTHSSVESRYLYSFIGAYNPDGYLSSIRRDIFEYSHVKDSLIIRRDQWHFEAAVYKEQICGNAVSAAEAMTEKNNMSEYVYALNNSSYSLCPSGAGPNTIRFWESLAHGVMPILISDTWDPPKILKFYKYLQWREGNFSIEMANLIKVSSMGGSKNQKEITNFSPEDFLVEISVELFQNAYIKKLVVEGLK